MPKDMTLFEKLRGKRYGDIELPMEGSIDPRLPDKTINKVQVGIDKLRQMREYRKGVEKALERK